MNDERITRRPLKTRNTRWAAALARFLARAGVRPNAISVASIAFAAGAGLCLWLSGNTTANQTAAWLQAGAALLIQGRLLCNLFDGMVAVEGGFKTKSGEIFNELPDRFADVLIIAAAGYAQPVHSWSMVVGWVAAVLAVMTAYVRALGVSCGTQQYFIGPMAKPHRMAVLTFACLGNAILLWADLQKPLIFYALCIVVLGSFLTIIRRTARILRELEAA